MVLDMIRYAPFLGRMPMSQLGQAPTAHPFNVQALDRHGNPMSGIEITLIGRGQRFNAVTDVDGIARFDLPVDVAASGVQVIAHLPEGSPYQSADASGAPMMVFRSTSVIERPKVTPTEVVVGLGGITALIAGFLTRGDLGKGLISVGSLGAGISLYSVLTRK